MTRVEVEQKLKAMNVPSFRYSLDGLKDGELYCVLREGDRWLVVYNERNEITWRTEFDSVEAAYDELIAELSKYYGSNRATPN